ncbi:MAG: class I SAM-dependent methyltransferase [Bacteroidota bacterium]|nr:class I SAM-dependent methyltransferase [Bacteroidota bacterium]
MSTLSKLSDFARYKLIAKDAHGIHSPFVFDLYNNVIEESYSYYDYDKLARVRRKLEQNNSIITIKDFGAGSKIFKSNERRISDICTHGIAPEKYARLLFRLVNFSAPATVIELGTSLGLTTMYLASAAKRAKVYSLEGSDSLVDFSRKQFQENDCKNIEVIPGNFDDQLPKLVSKLEKIDFVYIDGNHLKEPTLRYFEEVLKKSHNDSVIVFDDINWSEEMKAAWKEIKDHPQVRLTLDLHFIGIVFLRQEQKEKEHFVLKLISHQQP